jgi:ACS family allantoate permease-like MFS transporter
MGVTRCHQRRVLLTALRTPPCSFFSILIQSFGYSTTQSLLYTAPSGAVTVVFVITCLYLGDRYKKRILFAMFALVVGIVGVLLIWCLPTSNKVGRLMGYYL